MFFDANVTHFTVYIDGLSSDQNNNSPVDKLKSKVSSTSFNPNAAGGSEALGTDVSEALSGVGDKLSSMKSSLGGLSNLTSLDPFSTLAQANKLKSTIESAKAGFT